MLYLQGMRKTFQRLERRYILKQTNTIRRIILHYIQLDKKSIKRLSTELGCKWETVNQLAKDFKENLENNTSDPILKREIKIDEMYIHTSSKRIKKRTTKARIEKTWKRYL